MQKETLKFLKDLKKNNNREWFDVNRERYREAMADFTGFVSELIEAISKFDSSISRVRARDCVFRIFRDVRFAKDKSPYKTNFGAFISSGGKKQARPGYYFHVAPGEVFAAAGVYMPPSPELNRIRSAIAEDAAPLRKFLKSADFKKNFKELWGEKVKTAPRGYAKDHPDLDLLQFKSYIVSMDYKEEDIFRDGFKKSICTTFRAAMPLNLFLAKALDARTK